MIRRAVEAFQLLGIPQDSDRDTIAHAYRRLARTVHPDVSADAEAGERFANLAEAYRVATSALALEAPPACGGQPPPDIPVGDAVAVRRLGVPQPNEAPIIAGPVRIRPSSDHRERQRHG